MSIKALAEMGSYSTVVIDPPWEMTPTGLTDAIRGRTVANYNPVAPYQTLTVDEMREFPIADIMAPDSFLFCWTVNKMLHRTFELLENWGVAYSFTMSWIKSNGPQYPGSPMFNTEWCLVGRMGSPAFLDTKSFRTGNVWAWRGHSEKPEEFYDLLRRVTPGPRLDIFGRRRISGFDSWGMEAPDEPAPPEHYQQILFDS